MTDEKKIEVSDEVETIVEDESPVEESEVEEPEVEEQEEPEVEEPKEEKPKKEKKPKPARGKGRKEKGKGAEKGFSKGQAWWKETGEPLVKKGHSQRNVVLKAAQAGGKNFNRAMTVLTSDGTIEEKAIQLIDE